MMDGREKVNHENVTERTHEIEFRPCTCNSHPMISRWRDTIKSQVGSCNKSQVGSCNKSTASGITHKVSPCNKHYVQILPQTFPQNKVRLVTLKSKLCNTPFSSCHFVLLVYLIILLSLPAQGQDYETWEQGVPWGLRRQGFHPGGIRMDNSGFSLERGPLTLINGRLRPVSEEKKRLEEGSVKIPPPSEEPSYFPETTYPGNPRPILLKPEPEIYLTKLPPPLPASQDFNPNIQDFKEFAPSDNRRMDQGVEALVPKRSSSGDWSTRVDASTAQKEIVLDTKYFSLSYPEVNSVTSPDPGLEYVTGKPGLVLRKVKGRIKTSTLETPTSPGTKTKDLCEKSILECENGSNLNGSVIPEISSVSTLNSYEELLRHFRTEVWVIPVIVAAATVILILVIFEIFLLAKAVNKNPSRRHLFLGQMLLLGLFSLAGMSVVFTLKPTTITCAVIRFGTGFSYCIVYSTLLVKLVFLVSLNSGVYLPATYQSLLLCFAILIQLVIGIQWLVSAPPSILDLEVGEGVIHQACSTLFHQQLLGLLYVVFLIVVVVLLAFKSRSVRENYREALYVGLTMGFTVSIWIVWIVAGLIVPTQYQDVCAACGMIACASITFVIMYMPKGRQLSAMGKEGLYAEDRTDVYTGSGTGSTGSSGTPSPSFFPVKPGKLAGLDERIERKERMERIERMEREESKERQRLDTPTSSHRHLQIFGIPSARASRRSKHTHHDDQLSDDDQFVVDDQFHRKEPFGRDDRHRRNEHDRHERDDRQRRDANPDFFERNRFLRDDRLLREERHSNNVRMRSSSPRDRPSHLYGHPLFRASHGDLARPNHRQAPRFSSQRDLSRADPSRLSQITRSDPVRSSRRRMNEGGRSREILATISPRRLPSCNRCLPPGVWENSAFHY